MFRIGFPAMAGFAVDGFQVFRPFIFIKIEISLIDEDSHPHHLPCIFFHYIFIGCIIKAIRKILYGSVTEAAITTQGFGIRFHNAIQFLFADILWKYLQVFIFPIWYINSSYASNNQGSKRTCCNNLFVNDHRDEIISNEVRSLCQSGYRSAEAASS